MRSSLIWPILALLLAPVFASASSDFSIVLLPDTQNYSQYHPGIFLGQTQWIVKNLAARNIRAVIGEGDIVNHDGSATEWANADKAANVLDGKVPYAFAIGNHDYDNQLPAQRGAVHFNAHFGPQRYAGQAWYGGNYNGSNENFYMFFSGGGREYIVLVLEYYPRTALLDWADSVLSSYPGKQAIVVTHTFQGTDGFRLDRCDITDMSPEHGNTAQTAWEKVLKWHSNVFLIVSGHLTQKATSHRTDVGVYGNLVHQIFTNFQDWENGGDGYLRVLTFHPDTASISVTTYSPYLNASLTTAEYQFTLPLKYLTSTSTGQIRGKVRSTGCARLSGATVSVQGQSVTTSTQGVYTVPALQGSHTYDVSAAASGFLTTDGVSPVNGGLASQLNFYLPTASSTTIKITSPTAGSTVSSPVTVSATATPKTGTSIIWTSLYINGLHVYGTDKATLNTTVTTAPGTYSLTIQAKDSSGFIAKKSLQITVK